ncbi:hypothetical protein P152DRAFT_3085 [Eremomyces bilateralis CBS 781.70]|uniref:Hamartin n=1 Tax=Eremomyces bilateralis CBS 781.70 TaxID=1392243 RepID=A0A6G1GG92_9PEZI|nr:uncharacterized protein P152DRAFT_3085 [Eremomyces bilateralis CBS 781.70]KAF1816880.1 hypothetical protein P152DRAFT_3085 [Eremomyces bilateralis CBS 781.70]
MAFGTLKDVVRTLDACFSSPSIFPPLPDELQETINAFLDANDSIEPADSQRLAEELHTVFQKYVQPNPDKHAAFISLIRTLRPAYTPSDSQLYEWWNKVIRPTIGSIGHKRTTIDNAREFMLSVLVYDEDSDEDGQHARLSRDFTAWLLDAYMARSNVQSRNSMEMQNPGDELKAHELEKVLLAFGRKRPKELLLAVDDLFIKNEHRAQALGLLSAFVHVQPPHLYLVLETSLVDHLLTCLLVDTSGTIVDLALTVLIMFIPHITSSLVSYLPRLFLIFNRIVCWDLNPEQIRSRSQDDHDLGMHESPIHEQFEFVADPSWEKLTLAYDNDETIIPKVDYFFTFLYGLFPLNFTSYLRKPRRYFKNINFPGAQEIDFRQSIVASRTETYRRSHILHKAFYSSVPEDELSDTRFIKSDPAELVTQCLDLYNSGPILHHLKPPPASPLPELPRNAPRPADFQEPPYDDDSTTFAGDSWTESRRNTRSTTLTAPPDRKLSHSASGSSLPDSHRNSENASPSTEMRPRHPLLDSPTIPPHGSVPIQKKPSAETMRKRGRRAPRSGTTTPGEPASATEPLPPPLFSCSTQIPPSSTDPIASLQLENLRLRNELHFQQYLKSETATFLGAAKRRDLTQESAAADTQKLLSTNRTLQSRLKRQEERYEQLRKEVALRREGSRAWDKEVEGKVRLVRAKRDEDRRDAAALEDLRVTCQQAQGECDHLRNRLEESEARSTLANESVRALQSEVDQLHTLEQELEKLRERVSSYEDRELDFERMRSERDFLRGELESAARRALARDREIEQIRNAAERAVADLEMRLAETQNASLHVNAHGAGQGAVQQIVESALAAKQANMAQLQKAYRKLHDRCVDLELRNQELEAGYSPVGLGKSPAFAEFHFGDAEEPSVSPGHYSPVMANMTAALPPMHGGGQGVSRVVSGVGTAYSTSSTRAMPNRTYAPAAPRGSRHHAFNTPDAAYEEGRTRLGNDGVDSIRSSRLEGLGKERVRPGSEYRGSMASPDRSHIPMYPGEGAFMFSGGMGSPIRERGGMGRENESGVLASGNSAISVESGGSKKSGGDGGEKPKVTTGSKARIYGRGE